jgi:hypothetical protein
MQVEGRMGARGAEGKVRGRGASVDQGSFEDIEQSLIRGEGRAYCGINDFEQLFEKKRLLGEAIEEFHGKNKLSKEEINKMQRRLFQIEHLAERADKQSVLLRGQIERINEAHTVTKLLTIERMIKAKAEHDELQRRRENNFRIREEKQKVAFFNQSRGGYRNEKQRQLSFIESKMVRDAYLQQKSQTVEVNRRGADKVREDKARLRDKLRRYELFKMDQARRNYQDKMMQLKETLEDRERKLDNLYREELREERSFETTEQVTKEYLGSLFPTETI